jgi:predicted GNAT superfamily acetyltransferase
MQTPHAARYGEMIIRRLTTLDECRQVAALEKAVWEFVDAEDVVPPALLIVSIKRGGLLLGAFDDADILKGFVFSMPALKDGRPTHWSHMLAVTPDARSAGIGLRLKLAQRTQVMEAGVDLIEWTYDPLQALNAHLNFARLGVVVEEYEENVYGDSSSPLHKGTPTDRFIAEWRLTAPHVERRLSAPQAPLLRDAAIMSAVLVNPSRPAGDWLEPGDPVADVIDGRRVLVEIPANFTEMQRDQPDLALEWRMATRQIFHTYLNRGYRVVDFLFAREAGRGEYLLARKNL